MERAGGGKEKSCKYVLIKKERNLSLNSVHKDFLLEIFSSRSGFSRSVMVLVLKFRSTVYFQLGFMYDVMDK